MFVNTFREILRRECANCTKAFGDGNSSEIEWSTSTALVFSNIEVMSPPEDTTNFQAISCIYGVPPIRLEDSIKKHLTTVTKQNPKEVSTSSETNGGENDPSSPFNLPLCLKCSVTLAELYTAFYKFEKLSNQKSVISEIIRKTKVNISESEDIEPSENLPKCGTDLSESPNNFDSCEEINNTSPQNILPQSATWATGKSTRLSRKSVQPNNGPPTANYAGDKKGTAEDYCGSSNKSSPSEELDLSNGDESNNRTANAAKRKMKPILTTTPPSPKRCRPIKILNLGSNMGENVQTMYLISTVDQQAVSHSFISSSTSKTTATTTSINREMCNQIFPSTGEMVVHVQKHHVREKLYACQFCGKGFATHSNRKEHERIHTGERPYVCIYCNRGFVQISNLKNHMKTHKDKNDLKCKICLKQFVTNNSLVLHQRAHAVDRKFKCKYCDKAYNYQSLVKRHERIHTGETPYSCDVCSKPFHELVSLKYHRKKEHTGERPYKCSSCPRAFILSSDLKKHLKVHLKTTPMDEEIQVSLGSDSDELMNSLIQKEIVENGSLTV